jgi:hypothetical protein
VFAGRDMPKIGVGSMVWTGSDCGCQSIPVLDFAERCRDDRRWQLVGWLILEMVKDIVEAFEKATVSNF